MPREQEREQTSDSSGKQKVTVTVTIQGRAKLEFVVDAGTEVSEILKKIEKEIGSLEGFQIRLNDKTLKLDENGDRENPTIETNATLLVFKALVGGK